MSNLPPVEVGEEHEVTIDSFGEKGDGVARIQGYVVFIPEANSGSRYLVQITKVMERFGFADIIQER